MSATPGMPEYGGLADRIKELEAQVARLSRARSLQSSSIGSGGLTVKDGGDITVDGGAFKMTTVNGTFELSPLWVKEAFDFDNIEATTSESELLAVSLVPPDWVGSVAVTAFGSLGHSAANSSGGVENNHLTGFVRINGVDSPTYRSSGAAHTVTGFAGDQLRLSAPLVFSRTIDPAATINVSIRGSVLIDDITAATAGTGLSVLAIGQP